MKQHAKAAWAALNKPSLTLTHLHMLIVWVIGGILLCLAESDWFMNWLIGSP